MGDMPGQRDMRTNPRATFQPAAFLHNCFDPLGGHFVLSGLTVILVHVFDLQSVVRRLLEVLTQQYPDINIGDGNFSRSILVLWKLRSEEHGQQSDIVQDLEASGQEKDCPPHLFVMEVACNERPSS